MTAGADATLRFDVVVTDRGGTRTIQVVTRAIDGTTSALQRQGQQATRTGQQTQSAADQMRTALERAHAEAIKEDKARTAAAEKERRNTRLTIADLGDLGTVAKKTGMALTDAFSAGAQISTKNPYVLAAAAVAAGLAANVGAAALAGAALTGLGAGFVALSLKSLQSSERITAAMENVSGTAKSVMSDAAKDLEDDWLGFFSRLEDSVVHVGPAFEDIFDVIDRSNVLDDLNDGLDGLISEMMPGLTAAAHAAVPALEAFAENLPAIGQHLGNFFGYLSEAGPGAVTTFNAVLDYLLTTLEMVGWGIQNVSQTIEGVVGIADAVTRGGFSKLIGATHDSTDAMDAAAGSAEKLAQEHKEVGDELERATFWTKSFVAAQGLLNDEHIAVAQAELRSIEANKQFQDALKESKGRLDGKTAAARKTQGALIAALEAAGRFSDSLYDESQNSDVARDALYRQVEALRAQTTAGSAARARIDALIAGFVAARPKSLSAAAAIEDINTQIRLLRDKQVTAKAKGDSRELDALQAKINALRGKTLQIIVNQTYRRVLSGQLDYYGNPIAKRAAGGPVTAGTPYIVGEKRPELFVPSQNGTIMPRVPAALGGGNTYAITINTGPGANPAETGRAVVAAIQEYERRNGAGWRA